MENREQIKQMLAESGKRAQEQIDRLKESGAISFGELNSCITAYIQAKFMLKPEECEGVDFQELSELSLAKSMKLSPDLVKEFDTARSCAGATSAIVKKTLLYMSIEKSLGIELAAEKTPKVHTFEDVSMLVWDGMKNTENWLPRLIG